MVDVEVIGRVGGGDVAHGAVAQVQSSLVDGPLFAFVDDAVAMCPDVDGVGVDVAQVEGGIV